MFFSHYNRWFNLPLHRSLHAFKKKSKFPRGPGQWVHNWNPEPWCGSGQPGKVFNEVEGGCHGLGVVLLVVGVFLVLGEFASQKEYKFSMFFLGGSPPQKKNIEGDCVCSTKNLKNKVGGFYIYLLRMEMLCCIRIFLWSFDVILDVGVFHLEDWRSAFHHGRSPLNQHLGNILSFLQPLWANLSRCFLLRRPFSECWLARLFKKVIPNVPVFITKDLAETTLGSCFPYYFQYEPYFLVILVWFDYM